MARIPDASAFGARPTPRTARGIVSDQSAEIIAGANARFAQNVGNIVSEIGEREDRFAYSQARSALLQADIAARKSLENDQDFSTYETRYGEAMNKARADAAKMIRGNRDRAVFESESKLDVERGLGDIRGKARAKEGDWGRSTLDRMLESNRSAALNAADEPSRSAIIDASKDAIIGAQQKGYLSEQEATNQFQRFRDSYALGSLEMMTPEKRIEALTKQGTAADYLQPDVRTKLLEHAKREGNDLRVRRESQAMEDAIMAKHGATASGLSEARKITDPEVRDATVSRIKAREVEQRQQEIETRDALGEEAMAFINGGGKFADLPLRIKNGLKPSQLNSLRSYAEQTAGGAKVRTNKETYLDLSSLFANDPQKFGEVNMLEYKDRLSDQDWEEFADLQRKVQSGNLDGKASGFKSIVQIRDERMREVFGSATPKGDKAKKSAAFVEQFEDRLKAIKAETGKPAKADDARKILDDLTAQVSLNWASDKKAYELTDKDIAVPQADRNEIIHELRKRGKPVTDEAILSLYRAVNGKQ